MKRRILLVALSSVVVMFIVGGIFVLAESADKAVGTTPSVKNAASLTLSEDITSIDKEYYERKDAPSSKRIDFEGERIDATYYNSIIDDCGNVIDLYISGMLNQFSLNQDGDVVGFWKYYSVDEAAKFDNNKYVESITEIATEEEALTVADEYLTEVQGLDLDNCELLFAKKTDDVKLFYIAYATKVGDFVTEDVYYVDVAITGEIFGFNHKASPVPEEDAVSGFSYEDIEQRAIEDIKNNVDRKYNGCTVKNIYAVSLDDGDYFKVVLDVYRELGDTSATTADSNELYYKIP